ncbi:(2Fe-2S)-binding protein [Rhizobium sp. CG5]|uniref:(2Fe-2S)-binding protein n=1 Tax=Rhizobium sp. CG5 TaxID=2726076 RepID=UPI002033327A|nr:(2Fe-2S)-binding protein [Rhizobium sp. CG5]
MMQNEQQLLCLDLMLNGQHVIVTTSPDQRLTEILRDQRHQTATKLACGIGRCGACTVLMNGKPVNACLVMAWQLDGATIVTAEGLDALPEAIIVRDALAEENAFQCGYCAPGFSVVLTALLIANPDADEADIRAGLEGNLCRCTGYHSIIRGALLAADILRQRRAADAAGD